MRKIALAAAAAAVIFCIVCGSEQGGKAEPSEISEDGLDMVFVEGDTFTMIEFPVFNGFYGRERRSYLWNNRLLYGKENIYFDGTVPVPVSVHRVGSFYISKYEVTYGLWKSVMGVYPPSPSRASVIYPDGDTVSITHPRRVSRSIAFQPSEFTGSDSLPVGNVIWDQIMNFILRLNEKTGKKYRLPTDIEWEYAARGGKKREEYKYYSGSDSIDEVAWYGCDGCEDTPHIVGTKRPNELGIFDMSGNVWELTRYERDAEDDSMVYCSKDVTACGGGWRSKAMNCGVSSRSSINVCLGFNSVGFRLIRDAETQPVVPPDKVDKATRATLKKAAPAMILVKSGTFTMGCTDEQYKEFRGACNSSERPAHRVTLSNFSISKYEVTQGLWKAVMGSNPSVYTGDDNLPVDNVSWHEIQEFIHKLNSATGKKYRLPTEAEWEYAARGGNRSRGYNYSGSNTLDEIAWYGCDEYWAYHGNCEGKTHIVGTKRPNELGIYDMNGNVSEWVNDWYGDYGSEAQINPTGASSGPFRVIRGCYFATSEYGCRLSERDESRPEYRHRRAGFRLAHDP